MEQIDANQMQLTTWVLFGLLVGLLALFRKRRIPAVLLGAALLSFLHPGSGLGHLDLNVLGLFLGMMLLSSQVRQTGLAQYLAIRSAKLVRGNPTAILILYSLLTMVAAALWGSVTAVMLMIPVSLLVAVELDISPLPFVMAETTAAGIGGLTTAVGSPVAMLTSAQFGLNFLTYSATVLPVLAVVAVVFFVAVALLFRRNLRVTNERKARVLDFDERKSLPDAKVLTPVLTVLGLVFVGFCITPFTGTPLAVIALGGAAVLMLVVAPDDNSKFLGEIDWSALVFWAGLMLMVGALLDSGLPDRLVPALAELPVPVLWLAAMAAALVDNVTAITVLAPLVQTLAGQPVGAFPIWLPVVLGAGLGGGATLVGAWANVVAAGLAGKSGYKVSFWTFTRYGMTLTVISLLVVTLLLLAFR